MTQIDHPENLPTYIVWERPDQLDVRLQPERSKRIAIAIQRLFPPPLFHHWILQEIIKGLKRKERDLRWFRGRLVPIDVCLADQFYSASEGLYSPEKRAYFARHLGQWLTAQVMASSPARLRAGHAGFVIRCLKVEEGKIPPRDAWIPVRPWHRFARKRIEAELLGIDKLVEIPFWLEFPRARPDPVTLELKHIIAPSEDVYQVKIPPEKRTFLPWKQPIDKSLYPLVDDNHAELVAVTFPHDRKQLCYIQHHGQHETWIYKGKEYAWGNAGLGPWNMVPRDGWVPVEPGNIVLLGRMIGQMIETANAPRIVPGSLALEIKI